MALKKSQRSLKAWGTIKALSPSEYARSTAAKRKATRKGKQFSKQPKKIARKTRAYRKVT